LVMSIYFLRHGESEGNCRGGYYGQTDMPLTDKGKYQAHVAVDDLKELLKNSHSSQMTIYTSPLQRAKWTAEYVQHHLSVNCSFEVMPQLMEINFGRWEGLSYAEIQQLYPEKCIQWQSDWPHFKFPEGESFVDFYQRINWCWQGIKRKNGNSDALIVAHGGVIKVVKLIEEQRDWQDFWQLECSLGQLIAKISEENHEKVAVKNFL